MKLIKILTNKRLVINNPSIRYLIPQTKSFISRNVQTETNSLQPNQNQVIGRSGKTYSLRTVKIITTIGRLLGYTLQKSTAVTLTSNYYDRCADRFNQEKSFWVKECGLPDSFQTWFQVTQLHMWLLSVRFRAMKAPLGEYYLQEFINHSFIDIDERIRGPENKISKGTLIKKYMKLLLDQHRGFETMADWSISRESHQESDQLLAALIWRNLFGAAWGSGMGGVNGIFDPKLSNQSNLTIDRNNNNNNNTTTTTSNQLIHSFENDVKFAQILERLIYFIRKELIRLDQVSDEIITSSPSTSRSPSSSNSDSNIIGLTQFNKI